MVCASPTSTGIRSSRNVSASLGIRFRRKRAASSTSCSKNFTSSRATFAKPSQVATRSIPDAGTSMITRVAYGTVITHAGPEIGVASTIAFTAQMIALYLFGLYLGQLRGTLTAEQSRAHVQELAELPVKMEHVLSDTEGIEELAK